MLSCVERICGPFSILASLLLRFLLVILMIVKEASYPSLERRCLLQITDGTGAVEELPLKLRGDGIPAHKHGRAQAHEHADAPRTLACARRERPRDHRAAEKRDELATSHVLPLIRGSDPTRSPRCA